MNVIIINHIYLSNRIHVFCLFIHLTFTIFFFKKNMPKMFLFTVKHFERQTNKNMLENV